MSDTGGGHRASAQALDRSLSEQFPGKINVTIMDIWTDHAQPPFNKFVPVYRYLAKNPLLWRGFYLWGLFPPSKMFTEIWSWQNSYKSFKKAIACSHPDLVVSVHPLCQLMPIWAVEEINKVRDKSKFPVNFVTVVTDLGGAHKTWFDRRADKVFIPSLAVKKVASANRIVPDKIVLRGLPIRPAFWKLSKPKSALRRALGLEDKSKMVLVMGGGDGVGGLGKIVIEIADRLGKAKSMQGQKSQVVVICGNNKKLVQQLQAKKYHDSVRVVVKGFVGTFFIQYAFLGISCFVYPPDTPPGHHEFCFNTELPPPPPHPLRQRRRVHGGQ
jgi:1,2-diacylglycerol 3-beta-galactosyltransferase